MIVQCAACHSLIGNKPPNEDLSISHGVCEPCRLETLVKLGLATPEEKCRLRALNSIHLYFVQHFPDGAAKRYWTFQLVPLPLDKNFVKAIQIAILSGRDGSRQELN